MNQTVTKGPRPSDKWIPYYLALAYFFLLLPLAPMVYYAVHTMPGVVTEHSFEKGVAYNKSIQAGLEQQALGWKAEVTLEATAPTTAKVALVLHDKMGAEVNDAVVHVWLVRPAQKGLDHDKDMLAQGQGQYSAEVDLPMHGVWDVRVSATKQGQNFQTQQRVIVP